MAVAVRINCDAPSFNSVGQRHNPLIDVYSLYYPPYIAYLLPNRPRDILYRHVNRYTLLITMGSIDY